MSWRTALIPAALPYSPSDYWRVRRKLFYFAELPEMLTAAGFKDKAARILLRLLTPRIG